MDNENDIEIKITIDEAQARAILEQLDGSIKNISLSAEQGSKSISIFESAITRIRSGLNFRAPAQRKAMRSVHRYPIRKTRSAMTK